MTKKNIDIVCVGEILIDMIGDEVAENLAETKSFSNYVGGSATNVAKNMTQLGFNTVIIASIGDDDLGKFIQKDLKNIKLSLKYIDIKKHKSTSLIKVSRSLGTPEFKPYRQADFYIEPNQIQNELLKKSKIFHTTCFALSKNPAQTTILQKAKEAYDKGCQLSIDLNYAQKIWGDEPILPVLETYCQYHPFVKLSDDDAFRIFNRTLSNQEIFNYFIGLGAKLVCFTKGKEGAFVAIKDVGIVFQAAPKVDNVVDATGAGDAFWSGFLAGYLEGLNTKEALIMANKLVAKKIQYIGGLPPNISLIQIMN